MYMAEGLEFGEQHLDEDEFLTCERIPLNTLVEMVCEGRVPDATTQVAALRAWKILEERKRL